MNNAVDSSFIFIRRYKNSLDFECTLLQGNPRAPWGATQGVTGWLNINNQAGNFVNWVPYHSYLVVWKP